MGMRRPRGLVHKSEDIQGVVESKVTGRFRKVEDIV